MSVIGDSDLVFLLIDPEEGTIVEASDAACAYYGYSKEDFSSLPIDRLFAAPFGRTMQALYCSFLEGRNEHPWMHRLANGELRNVSVVTRSVSHGGGTFLCCLVNERPSPDFAGKSGRVARPSQARALVRETEVLSRELDHQVKNNLQLIESMIFLYLDRDAGRERVQRFRGKVRAISAAYEISRGLGDKGLVHGATFLKTIADSARTLRDEGRIDISIHCDEGLAFRLDQAVSIGIIVDSAIGGAIDRGGHSIPLHVELQARQRGGSVELRVLDDAPTGATRDDIDSAVARAAATQLRAELETVALRAGGAAFRCVFDASN